MESMISDALKAVSPNVEIWKEQVCEDFSRPAFFIQRITGIFEQEVGNRYREENSYMIAYFSDKNKQNINSDMWRTADKMRKCLKLITYNGESLSGKDINYRIEDDVLQFFVKYVRYLMEPMETTKINKLQIEME